LQDKLAIKFYASRNQLISLKLCLALKNIKRA